MQFVTKNIPKRNVRNYTYRNAFRIDNFVIKSWLDRFRKVFDGSYCEDCSNSDSQAFACRSMSKCVRPTINVQKAGKKLKQKATHCSILLLLNSLRRNLGQEIIAQ
jgi:hypothetical protein